VTVDGHKAGDAEEARDDRELEKRGRGVTKAMELAAGWEGRCTIVWICVRIQKSRRGWWGVCELRTLYPLLYLQRHRGFEFSRTTSAAVGFGGNGLSLEVRKVVWSRERLSRKLCDKERWDYKGKA
jgi:hypothetical protein